MIGTILDCEILAAGMDSDQLSGTIHKNEISDGNRLVKLDMLDVLRFLNKDIT